MRKIEITEEEVKMITSEIRLNLIQELYLHWQELGIEKTSLSKIVDMVDHLIFVALSSSRDKTLKKFIKHKPKK